MSALIPHVYEQRKDQCTSKTKQTSSESHTKLTSGACDVLRVFEDEDAVVHDVDAREELENVVFGVREREAADVRRVAYVHNGERDRRTLGEFDTNNVC